MPNILDTVQISGSSYDLKDKNAPSVSAVTQEEYDNLPSSAKTSNTFFVITDAQAGDLTNYYTKTETNTLLGGKADTATTYTKTEVDTALASKQTTLTAGTGIDITDNVISATGGGGGGKAIEAGRGITVTSGETADTVSFNLEIGYLTGNSKGNIAIFGYIYGTGSTNNSNTVSNNAYNSLLVGDYNHINGGATGSFKNNILIGSQNNLTDTQGGWGAQGNNLIAGEYNVISGNRIKNSTAFGSYNSGYTNNTFVSGYYNECRNTYEHASGQYNVSSSASTTFGDSGNTLFSVGNGTANDARHNAFEIRQNGDIYCSDGTNDVKLQDTITATAANTTALGGLKLVKLSQQEYDAITTKDNNTLYVIT